MTAVFSPASKTSVPLVEMYWMPALAVASRVLKPTDERSLRSPMRITSMDMKGSFSIT